MLLITGSPLGEAALIGAVTYFLQRPGDKESLGDDERAKREDRARRDALVWAAVTYVIAGGLD